MCSEAIVPSLDYLMYQELKLAAARGDMDTVRRLLEDGDVIRAGFLVILNFFGTCH